MKSKTLKSEGIPLVGIIRSDLDNKTKMVLVWRRVKNSLGNVPVYVMLLALSFIFLLPFIYMITRMFMTPTDQAIGSVVKWIPRNLTTNNLKFAFRGLQYFPKLWTSTWTTGLAVIGQLLSCTLVAYGLARFKFKGSGFIFALVLFTLIVPPQTIILPLFIQFAALNWTDSFLPIIVPSFFGLGLNGGLFIFIYRQFFKGLPDELENAALIDGCGIFSAYTRIILPNSRSSMLVGLILSMVWQWNNYFEPSIYIKNTADVGNLPMQISILGTNLGAFRSEYNTGTVMAASFLCVIPIIIVFFLLQRRFMKGIERVGLAN